MPDTDFPKKKESCTAQFLFLFLFLFIPPTSYTYWPGPNAVNYSLEEHYLYLPYLFIYLFLIPFLNKGQQTALSMILRQTDRQTDICVHGQ